MIYDEKRFAMEINDETRRRVAENLRKQLIVMRENYNYKVDVDAVECGNTTYRNIAWAVEPYGNTKKGNYVHIVELLADLIDQPTCKTIEHGRLDEFHVCKRCSRCSYGWVEDIYDKPYSCCPNCGAEVVK